MFGYKGIGMDRRVFLELVGLCAAAGLVVCVLGCRNGRAGSRAATSRPATRPGRSKPKENTSTILFRGASDASAIIVQDKGSVLVADDENNTLRTYGLEGGKPVSFLGLSGFLKAEGKFFEVDIEAAARIGDRAYWISSHGRNRHGKWRPNRLRFFATDYVKTASGAAWRPVGKPYADLVSNMLGDANVRQACPELAASFRQSKRTGEQIWALAPKDKGLNIEGLCASPDGSRLFIGFRNPLVERSGSKDRLAIVIALLNPAEVIDKSSEPRFARPLLWDLGGRGVRDMVYSSHHGRIFILAGPKDSKGGFALYRWSGKAADKPDRVRKLKFRGEDWRPEALAAFGGSDKLLLLSDDGVIEIPVIGPAECISTEHYRKDGTCLNKHLRDPSRRFFRGYWITP